jgi:hypothetical protein
MANYSKETVAIVNADGFVIGWWRNGVHERDARQTLYQMMAKWVAQPCNKCNIAEKCKPSPAQRSKG